MRNGSERELSERARVFRRRACDEIDPRLRGLRFDKSDVDKRASCGSVVLLLASYAPENTGVSSAMAITGKVFSARTTGSESIVTVAVRYLGRDGAVDQGPAVRLKVLAIKRAATWWLATPRALNPAVAHDGGLSDAQLRTEHRSLLRAAGG